MYLLSSIGSVCRRTLNKWTKRLDAVEVAAYQFLPFEFASATLQWMETFMRRGKGGDGRFYSSSKYISYCDPWVSLKLFPCLFTPMQFPRKVKSHPWTEFRLAIKSICSVNPPCTITHNEPYVCVLLSSFAFIYCCWKQPSFVLQPTWSHSNKV